MKTKVDIKIKLNQILMEILKKMIQNKIYTNSRFDDQFNIIIKNNMIFFNFSQLFESVFHLK